MRVVTLTEEMIGTRSPDVIKYPRLDVEGNEIDAQNRPRWNTRGIGADTFVCILSIKDDDQWQFERPGVPKAKG